jgi:hypothetical protein
MPLARSVPGRIVRRKSEQSPPPAPSTGDGLSVMRLSGCSSRIRRRGAREQRWQRVASDSSGSRSAVDAVELEQLEVVAIHLMTAVTSTLMAIAR